MQPGNGQLAARAPIGGDDDSRPAAASPLRAQWPARRDGEATLRIEIAESAEALAGHARRWQELADHAIEPNPFYEPWLLLPALGRLDADCRLVFALVFEDDGSEGRLCGFFPLERATRLQGLRVLRLWKHLHCFLCVPLLRPERARETLATLLRWAAANSDVLDFSYVSGDGPLQQLLLECLAESRTLTCPTGGFTRALWRRHGEGVEAYLAAALSGGVRKEYRRQRRRLEELGTLAFRSISDGGTAGADLEAFLRLEAGGWKGRENTALAQDEAQRRFVHDAVLGSDRHRVVLYGLFLDGIPIAMLLCFRSGKGLFAFKIAYDEAYAKYSPGVQLTLDVLADLHADPAAAWMDSCAMPEHPMINRLFKDRRVVQSLLVSTGGWRGDLFVSALPLLRWVGRTPVGRVLRRQPA